MVQVEAKIQANGAIFLKQVFRDHIGAQEGETIIIQDDKGKHGNFISIWKKPEEA